MNYSKKLSLVGLVLGFVFIVVFVAFTILLNKFSANAEQENQKNTVEEAGLSFSSLKDAVSKGVAMKCIWGVRDLYSGETFIKDDMLYITYKPGWETNTRHVIIKGNCVWEWTDGENGKKTCLENIESFYDSITFSPIQDGQMVDQKYNCVLVEIAVSMFEVPENIAF